MSRGNRDAASGILKSSMRDNYTEHGVDEASPLRTLLSPTLLITKFLPLPARMLLRPHSITSASAQHTVTRTSLV